MRDKLEKIKQEILAGLKKVKDSDSLRDLELKYLSRKGELTTALKMIGNLKGDDKKLVGKLANDIKKEIRKKISKAKAGFEPELRTENFVDATLPGEIIEGGHLHPVTQIQNELEDLFTAMGFMVLDGPELESDYYCFEALNIPATHPARDIQDTFYVAAAGSEGERDTRETKKKASDLVMRTHTSPVQIRAMEKYGAPLRCVVPGRVFRSEATDACHDSTFYQLEGLMIDKNISIASLISVMKEMLSGIFKKEVEFRVRPGYFPFVEPGLEVDVKCTICNGKGCPSCKGGGWLEMIGSGMVHPKVLEYGGIDSKKYNGFAFGLGLDRLVMLRYGINDIRLFHSGDLRFLQQF